MPFLGRRRRRNRANHNAERKIRREFVWAFLIAVYLILSVLVVPALSERRIFLSLGSISSKDIKAPFDLAVPDSAATEAARRAAEVSVPAAFQVNRNAERDVFEGLEDVLASDTQALRSMWLATLSAEELTQVVEAARTLSERLFARGVASEAQKDFISLGEERRVPFVDEAGKKISESGAPFTLQELSLIHI